jgi:hypothetical protein
MNELEDDGGQLVNIETVQIPLRAYALKRQVFLMNFTNDDLSLSVKQLFFIFMAQFHPLFTFKYRFDPNV